MVQAMVAVFAAPGDAEKGLVAVAALDPGGERGDRGGLVAGRAQRRDDLEGGHAADGTGGV